VEQSLGRPCRLADSRSKRTYELTSSIVPRGTSFHRSAELGFFLLSRLILHGPHAAVTSRVHRNSVPSTQMRCQRHDMPRASLRSVLLICACNTARMCRVSTQITGKPASAARDRFLCAAVNRPFPQVTLSHGVGPQRKASNEKRLTARFADAAGPTFGSRKGAVVAAHQGS
jgi:hypothetical protein